MSSPFLARLKISPMAPYRAAVLLPDELPVSLGEAVSNFAALTGRKPADDATDVALQVVVGIASLHSDNVDANDVPFLSSFPYLAAPNN